MKNDFLNKNSTELRTLVLSPPSEKDWCPDALMCSKAPAPLVARKTSQWLKVFVTWAWRPEFNNHTESWVCVVAHLYPNTGKMETPDPQAKLMKPSVSSQVQGKTLLQQIEIYLGRYLKLASGTYVLTHTYAYICTTLYTLAHTTHELKKKKTKHSHVCSLRVTHRANLIHGQQHLGPSLRTRTVSQSCQWDQAVVGYGFNPESYKNSTMASRLWLG